MRAFFLSFLCPCLRRTRRTCVDAADVSPLCAQLIHPTYMGSWPKNTSPPLLLHHDRVSLCCSSPAAHARPLPPLLQTAVSACRRPLVSALGVVQQAALLQPSASQSGLRPFPLEKGRPLRTASTYAAYRARQRFAGRRYWSHFLFPSPPWLGAASHRPVRAPSSGARARGTWSQRRAAEPIFRR